MGYYVSRQCYWPDGDLAVEIVSGGGDDASPNMLVPKYAGEGEEYDDPRDAATAAEAIAEAWQAAMPDDEIGLTWGSTGGGLVSLSGEAEPLCAATVTALRAWAEKAWERMEKCGRCGGALASNPRSRYRLLYSEDEEFCSESCADTYYWEYVHPRCEECAAYVNEAGVCETCDGEED